MRFCFFPIKLLFHQGNLTPTSLPWPTPLSKRQTDAENDDNLLKKSKNHGSVQKRLEVFLFPLYRMQVHHRSLPCNFVRFPQQFASTHLYTWVERGTVRVKCLAQEHNTMSPARAQTQTAHSGVERTNHEANTPPYFSPGWLNLYSDVACLTICLLANLRKTLQGYSNHQ